MTGCRLDQGGRIDRGRPIDFSFEGRNYRGFAGDTLASALLANGVQLVGRSFKLHRPRGVLSAGPEEPNALVDVVGPGERRPNLKATEVELIPGLAAVPVNAWPSLGFDALAANAWLARFIPAGFYYKTFFWPRWRTFEPFIRRAAGLGRLGGAPARARSEHRYAHCDVLVVGGGRAGLASAAEATASGARVMLCDQDAELGGRLLWDGREIDGEPGPAWAAATAAAIAGGPASTVLTRTTAIGVYDHGAVTLAERLAGGGVRLWQVRPERLLLATGRTEQPLVFDGNDTPGVMLAGAVLQYIERFAVCFGRRAVVFTTNDAAYATAAMLARRGAATLVVDSRPGRAPADLPGVEVLRGASVVAAHGGRTLSAVTVASPDGARRRVDCDLLAVSGGYAPNLQLFTQAGGRIAYAGSHAFAAVAPAGVSVVGSASARDPQAEPPISQAGKALVDLQNDVTAEDIGLAAREGFVSVEHLKRYTALGMGTDQGRTSGSNTRLLLAQLAGRDASEVGAPRARPPLTPVPLVGFAGQARGPRFHASRRTPLDALHRSLGAVMDEYGGWRRPVCYPKHGEDEAAAVQREALAVRERVGLFDASPLGKIEVVGPDAALFLDRIYANAMSSLPVGRARYGVMLNELGVIIDDGVALRLAEDRFLVGASSGGAGRIAEWLEEWRQCEWPELRVIVAPMTTAMGVVSVSGPAARRALDAAGADIDLSADAFPHMSVRVGRVAGIPARIARVSFTGELTYEVNVPASRTEELWRALSGGGREAEATPVGVEAWLLLRLEKGFLHVGMDTDGTTAPDDVGMGHVGHRRADFVGKRSLSRPDNRRPDRHQLVGLQSLDGRDMPAGSHLVRPGVGGSEGFITSAGRSATLGRPVALALVKGGRARLGEVLSLAGEGAATQVRIVERAAYDPQGGRAHV